MSRPLLANWVPASTADYSAARRTALDYERRFGWWSPDEERAMEWGIDVRAPLAEVCTPYALWRGGWLELRAAAWMGRN